MHAACGITTHHLINFNSFSLTLFSRHKESTELLCSQLNKYFITNCHLLQLNVDEDDINQESHSDISFINSYIEVDDAQQVNHDFIPLNLYKNEYSSEEI
jgi:hypothetical protein